MACGGGSFVIAALLERVVASGTPEECSTLNECLSGLREDKGKEIKGWAALSEGIRLLGLKAVNVS
jgi:hypothetical protein